MSNTGHGWTMDIDLRHKVYFRLSQEEEKQNIWVVA